MSEFKMTEENKKTITAFVAGLLVGGLLVFIFSNPTVDQVDTDEVLEDDNSTEMEKDDSVDNDAEDTTNTTSEADTAVDASMTVDMDNASVQVSSQEAGDVVMLDEVTFPSEAGWIGVRDYENDQLTGLLGVSRWNKEESLVPGQIALLRATESGRDYAIVFYSDDGDKEFDLANDAQISGVVATFTAK